MRFAVCRVLPNFMPISALRSPYDWVVRFALIALTCVALVSTGWLSGYAVGARAEREREWVLCQQQWRRAVEGTPFVALREACKR